MELSSRGIKDLLYKEFNIDEASWLDENDKLIMAVIEKSSKMYEAKIKDITDYYEDLIEDIEKELSND